MNLQIKSCLKETDHWSQFRKNIIGHDLTFQNEHGQHNVLYADWIASGRLYRPIEHAMTEKVGNVVANPHSYSCYTGAKITELYTEARTCIKRHVKANKNDILVTVGSGMTDALLRLQEILRVKQMVNGQGKKPVVFITHMEHHSNQVSWMECDVDVVVVPPNKQNLVDPSNLRAELSKYQDRKLKIGAFSACSNVTGVINPIHQLAKAMHEYGGYCFADYAASAPYVDINMHPEDPSEDLDAIFFSPHKFLGGPGSCGVLIFNKMFHTGIPNIPGGGNVRWTNPWGGYGYTKDIEAQEDGGTPAFLQTIKAAMAIKLKEQMGTEQIRHRESELLVMAHLELQLMDNVELLEKYYQADRIGCLAFNIKGLHYNLVVRLLNDRYGIQARGGWSCASTYSHYLFDIDKDRSRQIMTEIDEYNASTKPGWVRLSLHPTMTNKELDFCMKAINEISSYGQQWAKEFEYNPETNEFDKIQEFGFVKENSANKLYVFDHIH